jgi:acyl-CoA synthetase (AMP-forming)/AMP-acid ligase II
MTATLVEAGDDLPLTVPALLQQRASRGDHPLLICDDATLTYAEAETRSATVARGLLAAGAGNGTHVGLLLPNGPEFAVGWLAAARIGAVTVPISTFSTPAEIAGLLRGADVEFLLAASAFRNHNYVDKLQQAIPELDLSAPPPLLAPSVPALRQIAFVSPMVHEIPVRWTIAGLEQEGQDVSDEVLSAIEDTVRPADRMVIVHTSGSTSAPKGVVHLHGPLIRHLDNLNQIRRYDESEVLFSNSPFFWIGGFAYGLLGTLLAGATLVCSNATEAADVLDLLERTRPTMTNGFAQSVAQLPRDPSFGSRDLSFIRRGNLWPIMPAHAQPADPQLRHNMLGMTEAGSVCLVSDDESDQPEHRRGSFGKPAPGFEARVVDPETGRNCAAGQVGELWFRSPFLMAGYYGVEREATFTPDGWYRTGDLCHVDDDGFYYFSARLGDMIKTAGANVSPREVEAAILDLTGLMAHVLGLPDPERGQIVAAAVRVPAGVEAPDVDALRTSLRAMLSAYKVPALIVPMRDDQVPMMSSGKLDAPALKAHVERHRGH